MSATAMPGAPLVSIVLPTYNRAHLLPHAIRSILAQSFTDFELIVVDDHSPDDTPAVVDSFDDPRIRYHRNDPNLRLPRSLNRGFSQARGHYLTWTSDDNLFAQPALERMVERLDRGDCGLVYADYYQFAALDSGDRPIDVELRRLPGALQLERGNHIGACFLYTRELYEAVGDYDPELFLVEDYDYWIRAAERFPFCHLPEPLYYFRRDEHTLFCSRFAEVKASDILARFKNGLVSEETAMDVVTELLLADPGNLHSGLLKAGYGAVHGRSWRLTQWYRGLAARYLRARLRQPLRRLLSQYRAGEVAFGETRDGLKALIQDQGRVEYFEPAALQR